MNKVVSKAKIMEQFKDGQRIMIGGFANRGNPDKIIDLLVESKVKNLTIIANDAGDPGITNGKLVRSGQVKKYICSHVGMNPEAGEAASEGKFELELVPQGTLAERIRCGGAGLGGVLVKTGIGTLIEEGKRKIEVDGETYLLETPLKADISLVKAHKADTMGNLVYRGTSRNFNPLVAMAGKLVIVEAEEIVPAGSLNPDEIITPGVFVHMILDSREV
ncbi:CoA transferase subunit A [Clostridium sp. SYSU_GA19001]|uniref:CoA transferase subunit A n=1 Tax=Clostridium caldaquaticum TaxID=2940653 RepID=UPI0020776E0B|nr:CoA transferase subunit A [Clostridium caldaquaticum]MCM8711246.1 CoA transferase subunit A [Clostridium caldaquaticum]